MTVSGDYTRSDYGAQAEPAKVFGLPLPTFLGWLIGLGGLLGAAFLLMNVVLPLKEETDAVTAKVEEGKRRLEQAAQIEAELQQAKRDLVTVNRQKEQVMSLFAEDKNLKTILLDLNQLIERNNARVPGARNAKIGSCPAEWQQAYSALPYDINGPWQKFEESALKGPLIAEAKLRKFEPDKEGIQTITADHVAKDTYLKQPLVGQLRRQTTDVTFEGTFSQMQSIFQTIEKLKPLLIVKDLKVVRKNPDAGRIYTVQPGSNQAQLLTNCQAEPVTVASFKLDALLPLKPPEPDAKSATKPATAASPAASPAP
jgi:type IV pilus assembly protein PilO